MNPPITMQLTVIIDTDYRPDVRALAFGALTLVRVLAPTWRHVVTIKAKGQPDRQETIDRPAGTLVGDRAALQARLDATLTVLGVS